MNKKFTEEKIQIADKHRKIFPVLPEAGNNVLKQ